MIRIVAPHFVAGAVLLNGQVVRAAPIIGYITGWDYDKVMAYAAKRRWQVELIICCL